MNKSSYTDTLRDIAQYGVTQQLNTTMQSPPSFPVEKTFNYSRVTTKTFLLSHSLKTIVKDEFTGSKRKTLKFFIITHKKKNKRVYTTKPKNNYQRDREAIGIIGKIGLHYICVKGAVDKIPQETGVNRGLFPVEISVKLKTMFKFCDCKKGVKAK